MKSTLVKRYWLSLLVAVATVCSAPAFNALSHASTTETAFLLVSDEAPGAAVFQDISGNNIQVTPTGNTNHSAAQSKFGDTSIRFDGSGDYLTLSQDPLYNVGSGNFTIDMWVFLNSPDAIFFWNYDFNSGGGLQVYQGSGQLAVMVGGAPSLLTAGPLPTGMWNHLAIVRNITQLSVYVNGGLVAATTLSSAYAVSSNPTSFGCIASIPTVYPMNGYLEAIRYTKGAIWTSSFTPPTTAAPVMPARWQTTDNNALVTEGCIGIGTATPQSALAVNGTVTAKEVVVTDAGWADFVFDEGYVVPEIGAVETFIKQNGRLPGIPRASVIAESGISVSEMFRLQMQKIEELTLYMIALEKKNREMGEKIRSMEAQQGHHLSHE